MNQIDVLWARIKGRAILHAQRGYLATMAEARMIVLQICREENAARPSPDALDRFALELVRLSLQARRFSNQISP
jgi:hypothetical protein